jgi:hypothetical protein
MSNKLIGLGIILFCVFMIGSIGCGQTDTGETITTTSSTISSTTTTTQLTGGREYYPNTDGYIWTYRVTSTSTPDVYTMRTTFDGTATVDSVVVQARRTEYILGNQISTYEGYFRVTDAGVFGYGSPSSPTTEARTEFVFPLEIGSSWTTDISTSEVVAIENVTVPLGTYNNCFKVVTSQPANDTYTNVWLASNVGIVKSEYFYLNPPTVTTTSELTSKNF